MNSRRVLLIAFSALITAIAMHVTWRQVRRSRPIDRNTIAPAVHVSAAERSLRPNYPYSVIAGGAYSPAELRYAIQQDSVVRKHYENFDAKSAWLVKLTEERYQYVSFRLHDQVFWTHNKLRIPPGEVLLTDGRTYARTRCGNRLSSTRQTNTTPLQPSTRLLSLPPFRPELLTRGPLQVAPAPPIGELAQEFPLLPFDMPRLAPYVPPAPPVVTGSVPGVPVEGYVPIVPILNGGGRMPGTSGTPPQTPLIPYVPLIPTTPPIAQVPEPASLYVFVAALTVSLWLLTRMMRQNNEASEGRESAAQQDEYSGQTD